MIEICKKEECTGCGACSVRCPKSAILMCEDKLGVRYPVIDEEKCVECKLCQKICPVGNRVAEHGGNQPLHAYASWALDKEVRSGSTSGGAATLFVKYSIEAGNRVYAVVSQDIGNVRHQCIKTSEELEQMRKSKYTQSCAEESYPLIKQDLKEGKKVLFIGTPCQAAGLKAFLGKDQKELLIVEIVCHGVPPQKYLQEHLVYLKEKYQFNPNTLEYRDGTTYCLLLKEDETVCYKKGWNNYKEKETDSYMLGFLSGITLRESCYHCVYKRQERTADITIGDFWGLGKEVPFEHQEKEGGISLILTNTKKGQDFLEQVSDSMFLEERTIKEAVSGNAPLYRMPKKQPDRIYFAKMYPKYGFEKTMKKYMRRKRIEGKRKRLIEIFWKK